MITDEQVYQLILSNNFIDEDKLKTLAQEAVAAKMSLADLLVDREVIRDENLGILIADALHLPFVSLSKVSIPQDILTLVPEAVARKNSLIAFAQDAGGIKVAMADPTNTTIQSLLAKKTQQNISVFYATKRDIRAVLKQYQKELQKSFDEMVEEQVTAAKLHPNQEISISKIVDLLIEHAYHNKASDIHVEPEGDTTMVRFRIDGMLHDVLRLPRQLHEQVVSRVKVLSRLRTDEHLSAQDGKIHHIIDDQEIDIRVSILPIVDGEKIVMRLLATSSKQLSIQDLGLSDHDFAKVNDGFHKPHGMVLSTGPTGSGKSTTIYAMIKIINTREKNISTIEDPVEYQIEGVNQIQVNPKTNLTFASGLRALLRQDPDVVFVGEIRDEETAGIAINAAMTGHLVFSTLHTNDAATTLPRLIDMHVEPFLVASTVNVIIGQRLVRKICEQCRVSTRIAIEDVTSHFPANVAEKHFAKKQELRAYVGKGCPVCHNTGYVGRIGIFEVLEVTEAIRGLIVNKATAEDITNKAIEEGMTTMLDDGLDKVAKGVTTLEEIIRVTKA